MANPQPEGQNNDLEPLKAKYVDAIGKQSEPGFAKRSPADKQEHQFYIERLQFRLKDAGLSKSEIAALEKEPKPQRFAAPARTILTHARTAMLVIHGIGEQNPYETLDQFARNLTRYLRYEGGIDDLTLSAQKIDHNDWVEAMIRLETAQHGPRSEEGPGPASIDLYEYYWAPQTEGKISYSQTISWLIKTTLTPIRMLDQNVIAIENEPDSEDLTRGAIFTRELTRIGWIYLPVAFLMVLLLAWMPSVLNLSAALKDTARQWTNDHPYVRGVMTLLFAISLVMYWIVVKQLAAKWLRWRRQETAMVDSSVTRNTFLVASVLVLIGIGFGYAFNVDVVQYFRPILNWPVAGAVASFAIARLLQYFLADFVGDVALYVNADAKASSYAVRRAILSGATSAINRILKDEDRAYEQVLIAGHSLGSVIAYDSLNELMNRCQAGTVQDKAIYATPDQIVGGQPQRGPVHRGDLARIKGLVTFGSPLDKVHYFFREFVPENQSVRSQILGLLSSFRTRPAGRDHSIYQLQHYVANQLSNVKWLNAWSREDPVSGVLHFYAPIIRQQFTYAIPIYAHLSYWEDLRFYAFLAEPLLLGKDNVPPLRVRYAVA